MLIRNDTPFAAIGFGDLHHDGTTMACIAVRASYGIAADGALALAAEQEIVMNDLYEGNPQRSPLIRVADLVGYKPAADVTVLGSAHAPRDELAESWIVGVSVGAHEVRLRVHGPRQWDPTLKLLTPTWKLGRAKPARSVALDYRLASGGYWVGDGDGRRDERNPLGPGLLRRDASMVGQPRHAPQIEAVDKPLSDPFAAPSPRGFGPIPPFWQQREHHLGSRDETWRRERLPLPPEDFSYAFFQTAHPDLILPHLVGNEVVRLEGLTPSGGSLAFSLPGVALIAKHQWFDGRETSARLTLDGLHLDLRRPEGPWRADLTWRGWIAQCSAYQGAILVLSSPAEVAGLPGQSEHGLALSEASS